MERVFFTALFRERDLIYPFCGLCLAAVGVASSGGDFMSDLFNKLAMRRKGEVQLYQEVGKHHTLNHVLLPLQASPVKARQATRQVTLPFLPAVRSPGCQMLSRLFQPLIQQRMMMTGKLEIIG